MDAPQTVAEPAAATAQFDPAKVKNYIARLRDSQNLGLGLAGGAIGASIGAALWAAITAATHFQIGFMAIGVGFITGYGVRLLGRGIDPIFGYVGAVLSLLGCAVGNILAVMIAVSAQGHIAFAALASHMTPQLAWQMLSADFNVIDVVFYALGLYYGYRNSFHRISKEELAALT